MTADGHDDVAEGRPAQVPAGRLALEGLLVGLGAMVASVPVLKYWQQPFGVPFDYDNDATFYLMLVRSMKENGWYLTNPGMGFPFGQEMHDLALGGDNLNFLVQRVLALFTEPATALNAFFVLTIATVAAVAHVVLRLLRVRIAVAAVVAVIYTFLPFHLIRRTPHALLSSYAMVPVAVFLALAVMSAAPPIVAARRGWWPGLRGGSGTWWTVAACVLLASTGSYYAFFAGYLIVVGGVAAALARRSVRAAWSAAWMAAIIVGVTLVNTAPSIVYWLRHGTNSRVAHRLAQDTELYGLRIQQLFLPRLQHRNAWAGRLADRAWAGPVRSEPGQQLGLIAAFGLAALLVVAGIALLRRTETPEGSRRQTVEHMGLLAIVAMLTAAISGFSFILALGGLTWIRGWNRISVVLGFMALAVVAFAVEAAVDAIGRRRGAGTARAALAAILCVMLLVAWYDQASPVDSAVRAGVRESWESDAAFFGGMADALPDGSPVYGFPAMTFPEGGAIGRIGLYDGARGYLHAPSLEWSFGGMFGRVPDPRRPELEPRDPATTVEELRDEGYRAAFVDRFGFADDAEALIAGLTSVVPVAGTSPDGRYVWFDLEARMEVDEYRRMAEVEDSHWWYDAVRRVLAQELGPRLPPGARILDAGGGTGATGAWLAEHGRLVAADFFPDALHAYLSLHAGVEGGVAADVQHLPFASSSFDAALCVTVLCHQSIPDPAVAVHELARVVRPGGLVCLWEPGVRRILRAHDRVTHTARRFSLGDLRALAVAAGLVVERATGAFSFLVPPAAVKAVVERGRTTSDLDHHEGGLGGVLGGLASAERRLLRHASLPAGLSVMVIARRP